MRVLSHCQPWQNKERFDLCLAAALHFCHDKTLSLFQTSVREQFFPTLATFVDYGQDESTMKAPPRLASKMKELPSIRRFYSFQNFW